MNGTDVVLADESDTDVWAPIGRVRILALAGGTWVVGLVAAALVFGIGAGGSAPAIAHGFDLAAPDGDAASTARVLAEELDVTFGHWTVDPAVDASGMAHGTIGVSATSRAAGAKSFKLDVDVVDGTGQPVLADSLTVHQLGKGRTAKGTLTVSLTPASADALAAHVAKYRPTVVEAVSY